MLSTRYDLRNFPRSLRVCYGSAPYDYKLSLTAALSLTPTPPASLRCRPASVPLSTRNHILLFRVVNAGALRVALHSPLSHTDSHVPPTHRGSNRLHPKPTALTRPKPRWSVRRCTYSTAADRQPLMSTPRFPRHGGVGKLSNRKRILEIACRFVAQHDTPLCCERQVANAPLSVSPPLRATSSSPPIATLNLGKPRERCCRKGQFPLVEI